MGKDSNDVFKEELHHYNGCVITGIVMVPYQVSLFFVVADVILICFPYYSKLRAI